MADQFGSLNGAGLLPIISWIPRARLEGSAKCEIAGLHQNEQQSQPGAGPALSAASPKSKDHNEPGRTGDGCSCVMDTHIVAAASMEIRRRHIVRSAVPNRQFQLDRHVAGNAISTAPWEIGPKARKSSPNLDSTRWQDEREVWRRTYPVSAVRLTRGHSSE